MSISRYTKPQDDPDNSSQCLKSVLQEYFTIDRKATGERDFSALFSPPHAPGGI